MWHGLLKKIVSEFAANHLHASLVIVLGHQNCGAVNAVLKGAAKQFDIQDIAPFIEKGVLLAKGQQGDPLQNAIVENAVVVAQTLSSSPILKKLPWTKAHLRSSLHTTAKQQAKLLLKQNRSQLCEQFRIIVTVTASYYP